MRAESVEENSGGRLAPMNTVLGSMRLSKLVWWSEVNQNNHMPHVHSTA